MKNRGTLPPNVGNLWKSTEGSKKCKIQSKEDSASTGKGLHILQLSLKDTRYSGCLFWEI